LLSRERKNSTADKLMSVTNLDLKQALQNYSSSNMSQLAKKLQLELPSTAIVPTDIHRDPKLLAYFYARFFIAIEKVKSSQGYDLMDQDKALYLKQMQTWLDIIQRERTSPLIKQWQDARFLYFLVTRQIYICKKEEGDQEDARYFRARLYKMGESGPEADFTSTKNFTSEDLDVFGKVFHIQGVQSMPTYQQLETVTAIDLNVMRKALFANEVVYIVVENDDVSFECNV